MGNGRSAPLQELNSLDLRGNGRRPDNTRGDAANMLIDDQVSNRGEVECVSTERNPQCSGKSTPADSNKTCSGSGFNDKKGHVWQEIASMYQQIVERDNGLLPSSTPRSTILMYRPPVTVETNCANTDHPRSSGANTKYVDSSTSTAEDRQLPREYYIIHGVNSTNEADHTSTHDVEMIERDIGNCPRILESFSLSESHCRFVPGQHIQQQDEYTGGVRLEMGNAHGLVYPAQVQDAWTPFKGVMKTEADTVSSEINESQLQQERHAFKTDPSEITSCCCGEPQNVTDTEDFNGERIPLQINGTARNERATTSDLCQMQGHCPQPEHTNQTEPMENIRSCCTRVEESKVSALERNHYSQTEEFRPSAAGPFAVKEEPMAEEEPPSFTDKNMIFGINCESNGSEITLKYGGTEEKGTQYLVEDTGLCPVSASKPCVSSSAWEKNVRVTKECGIYTRSSDYGGSLPSSNSYLSSDLSASKEHSATGVIQENTSCTVKDSGKNVAGNSTHEISTHMQAKSGLAVDYTPNTASEDALSALTVDSSTAKRSPKNIDPRESKISQLKRLLEKQEEDLEKVRSQRRWETDCSATTDNQEQVMNYVKEELKGDANDDTFVSGQRLLSNGHETKEKKSSCPRQNIRNKVPDRRETLAQAIRAEMAKQNQSRKGKRKGECFAYLDSTGVVVFGRKVMKKKSAVSSNRLEKLIFRLRKSLGKKKGVLKRKSRSKPLARRHKSPPTEDRTKENSPQDPRVAKQIPICKNVPNFGRKNKTSEAWQAPNPSTNEETKWEHQPSCSIGGNTGGNAAFKDAHMLKNNQEEFLATVGLTRKTLDFVTGRFSAHYGGPRRRFLDHEIQPTDCRGMRLGTDFEYRDEQGWFINETII